MTGERMTEVALATAQRDLTRATSGEWVGVPTGAERFEAGMRFIHTYGKHLMAHIAAQDDEIAALRNKQQQGES